jgi:hypothetical protein
VLLTVLLYDVAPSVSFVVVTVPLRHRGCVPSWMCVGYFPISKCRFLASIVVTNEGFQTSPTISSSLSHIDTSPPYFIMKLEDIQLLLDSRAVSRPRLVLHTLDGETEVRTAEQRSQRVESIVEAFLDELCMCSHSHSLSFLMLMCSIQLVSVKRRNFSSR